jgi:hypothetical protein
MALPNERRSSESPGEESAPFIFRADNTSDAEKESSFLRSRQANRWWGFGYLALHGALIFCYTILFIIFTLRKRECGVPSLHDLSLYCMSRQYNAVFYPRNDKLQ